MQSTGYPVWVWGMSEDAVKRSPSTLLRAVNLSNGRWTFYEVVNDVYEMNDCLLSNFVTIVDFTSCGTKTKIGITVG